MTVLREIFVNSVAWQQLKIFSQHHFQSAGLGQVGLCIAALYIPKVLQGQNRQMNPDSLLQVHFSPIFSSFPLWLSEHEFEQGQKTQLNLLK